MELASRLRKNLHGDRELAAKGLRAFLEGFVVAEPTGKQNTFAAHNPPEFVLVTVGRDTAPRNLANAFESAVRARDGLTLVSAKKLVEKAGSLQAAYGGQSQRWALSLVGPDMLKDHAQVVKSLDELLNAVLAEVSGG